MGTNIDHDNKSEQQYDGQDKGVQQEVGEEDDHVEGQASDHSVEG